MEDIIEEIVDEMRKTMIEDIREEEKYPIQKCMSALALVFIGLMMFAILTGWLWT